MQDYKKLDMPVLLDLLTLHTEVYTKLLAEKSYTLEFEASKFIIKHIQEEIRSRKETGNVPIPSTLEIDQKRNDAQHVEL